jgi:glucose/arabinose dehydrogenase
LLLGGPSDVLRQSDSGSLDVVPNPDYPSTRFIYLAFVEGTVVSNRTAIWKARLEDGRLTQGRVIFRVKETKRRAAHPGGRLLFVPDKTLL